MIRDDHEFQEDDFQFAHAADEKLIDKNYSATSYAKDVWNNFKKNKGALIGAVIIGVGLGTPDPVREEMAAYFQEKSEKGREYAYLYPGMNRVLQAAGRVIRDERDVGTVVLIDDRFATPTYRPLLPPHWRSLTFVGNNRSLAEFLRRFWCRHTEEEEE